MDKNNVNEEEIVTSAVIRLSGNILGITLGAIAGLLVFVATIWLVIKGGPNVGQHLQLLGQYFIGYRVTYLGSVIGFFYGFFSGYIAGRIIAFVYNGILHLRSRS